MSKLQESQVVIHRSGTKGEGAMPCWSLNQLGCFEDDSPIDNGRNRLKYGSLRGRRCLVGMDPGDSKDCQASRLSFLQKIAVRIEQCGGVG